MTSNGMKGCFVLQRRFLYLGHELAALLKEKGVVNEFCAYVQVRDGRDFLAKQKEIPYTRIILDEDLHKAHKLERLDIPYLERLEHDHGTLWRYIDVDRIVRLGQLIREYPHDTSPHSHEEILRITQSYAKRIEVFLDEEKPDFIYGYLPGSLGTLLLYAMAKKRGIPVFSTIIPLTKNLVTISERYDRLTGVENLAKKHASMPLAMVPKYAEARAFIDEFRKKPVRYSDVYVHDKSFGRVERFSFLLPHNLTRFISWFFGAFGEWLRNSEKRGDYSTVNPFYYLLDAAWRKLRNLRGVNDLYDVFDSSQPYVFYPLHYEPEMSVLLFAPFDTDQIHIIKRVAQSLPVGVLLYVKEHPQMVKYRPRWYYKELKKIPNVKLIRPELSGFELIQHASLITIISGAAGWEAILLGKPVITFGEFFYNALSFVKHSRTPEELPKLVERQLTDSGFSEEELVRFVAALFEDSAEVDLLHVWELERDASEMRAALRGMADVLAKKIVLASHRG